MRRILFIFLLLVIVACKGEAKLFFIALEDDGKRGERIGCNDSLVAVPYRLKQNQDPLRETLQSLLAIKTPFYGESGLYHALARSELQINRLTIKNAIAELYLTGTLELSGTCDAPRILAQLRATVLQFPAIKVVHIFLNGAPLEQHLSQRS